MAPKIGWTDVKGLKVNADLQNKKGHASKKNLPHYDAYLANFIIESVYHQVADSLWALRVGKVGGIF